MFAFLKFVGIYTKPFLSSAGIVEVEFGEINIFKTIHHFLEVRVSDLYLLEKDFIYIFNCKRCNNFVTKTCKAFPVSLCTCSFCFFCMPFLRICSLIKKVIYRGSVGRILT